MGGRGRMDSVGGRKTRTGRPKLAQPIGVSPRRAHGPVVPALMLWLPEVVCLRCGSEWTKSHVIRILQLALRPGSRRELLFACLLAAPPCCTHTQRGWAGRRKHAWGPPTPHGSLAPRQRMWAFLVCPAICPELKSSRAELIHVCWQHEIWSLQRAGLALPEGESPKVNITLRGLVALSLALPVTFLTWWRFHLKGTFFQTPLDG